VNTPSSTRMLAQVARLDPQLLLTSQTRRLVRVCLDGITSVTHDYGSPAHPKLASGSYEHAVLMLYHCGAPDGHTSLGPRGVGVPRNSLVLARAVNRAALAIGRPIVYTPLRRGRGLAATGWHDGIQLCGRLLLPEGRGHPQRGDERLAAERAHAQCLARGVHEASAQAVGRGIIATAFNTVTGAQNVDYSAWEAHPHNPTALQDVLDQELVAVSDLLGVTYPRGVLDAYRYAIVQLYLQQNGCIMQQTMQADGVNPASITTAAAALAYIGRRRASSALLDTFINLVAGQSIFFVDHLKYTDAGIRHACGQSIDQLFPGRLANGVHLAKIVGLLRAHEHPLVGLAYAQKLIRR
jgi:hypothetical protein